MRVLFLILSLLLIGAETGCSRSDNGIFFDCWGNPLSFHYSHSGTGDSVVLYSTGPDPKNTSDDIELDFPVFIGAAEK